MTESDDAAAGVFIARPDAAPQPDLELLVHVLELDPLRAVEFRHQRLRQLPAHRMRDRDAAGWRRLLQPHDEADRRAEAILARHENVSEPDAEPDLDRVVLAARISRRHRGLERDRPAHAVFDVGKLDQRPVAHRLEHRPAVLFERRPDDAQTQAGERQKRAALIAFHVARVAGNVQRRENGQLALCARHPGIHQKWGFQPLSRNIPLP